MFNIGFLLGALIPTFVLSRIILLLTKTWNGGVRRISTVHLMSLICAGILGGMGMADSGSFAAPKAIAMYSIPQTVWFVFDFLRHKYKIKKLA